MDTSSLGGCIFLQFILLYYGCGVQSCTMEVEQIESSEALLDDKTANVSCKFKPVNCNTGSTPVILWFRCLAATCEKLYPKQDRFTVFSKATPTSGQTCLIIGSIETQDSGIYTCAIWLAESNLKATGRGTMLTIRDKPDKAVTPSNIALLVLCILLFIYCIAVFSYHSFKSKWTLCKCVQNKDGFTADTNRNFRTRSIFQAIAAEYQKRYNGKVKKQVNRSDKPQSSRMTHTAVRKQNQVIEDDGIYQNAQDLQ